MQIIKNENNYELKNHLGSYHFSTEEYEKLGKDKAIKLALEEIKKKSKAVYSNPTINFQEARKLGFCEYGIKDFAKNLNLDINREYELSYLREALTFDMLKEYPSECVKLFGKNIIDKFGGVISILENNKTDSNIFYFIVNNFIGEDILHKFSIIAAYYSLKNFEKEFPNDNRPRLAIKTKEKWIKGEATSEELSAAWSAAESAARSAARSAAWSAESTAWSAAESAARSAARSTARSAAWSARSAAWSARSAAESTRSAAESTRSAAWSAVWSAAYEYFTNELIKLLKE